MKTFTRFFRDLKKYSRYIWTSAMSELRSEVANSYLNRLWWILEPLAFMFLYSFIFGTLLGIREEYYELFIFIGLTMWNFFNKTITGSIHVIKKNRTVIRKVYIPKFVLVLQKMTVNFIKMLFSIAIMIGMIIYLKIPLTWESLYALPSFIVFLLMTFSVSLLFAHFGVFVEDLSNVVRIGMRMLFYVSGVFFNVEKRIPQPYALVFSHINPVAFFIAGVRDPLIYGKPPSLKWLAGWAVVSLIGCAVGIAIIYKNENTYVKVI